MAENRIKAILAEKKINSVLLVEYLHKDASTISRWCNNKSQPHVNDLYKIAEFLKVDIRDLLVKTEWDTGPSPAEVLKTKREEIKMAKKSKKDKPKKRSAKLD
ncbi:helix-turn-helix transcriptional regulator [Siphonobacter curvatus]|uniref:XRE family transcriptional regulator n=1 Tax=Siphonobacter curvatus TaxID=2094562 RepID=A0A2S7IF19_9BACT|nr:helix-turn-helix transcriptional regulator [Siphonobacter curvatus]PQA53227.1 XRE family transcriptional regulator [Siphonobacter curvatus]